MSYAEMTNEQLLEEYDKLGRRYMYYAAAEGNWSREAKERHECEVEYFACQREINARGITFDDDGYAVIKE